MIEFPSMDETGLYFVTIPYVNWLLDRLGLEQGLVLERLAKLCRMLDSAKCSFGVLFSKEGITGERTTTDAAREQVKVFQQRGMVVVVVSDADIRAVAEGLNFITMLRRKYERVRLDLRQKGPIVTSQHQSMCFPL